MSAGDADNERLRHAFAGTAEPTDPQRSCSGDEEIWLAARGELSPERAQEVLDHSLECAACAESWRVAGELGSQAPDPPMIAGQAARSSTPWVWFALPVAAALVTAFVWLGTSDRRGGTSIGEFREPGSGTIDSRLDETVPLPRGDCVLRWTEGPDGTLYSVAVSTENLTVIARAEELNETSFTVPPAALETLPSGTTILWRVEALLPDATGITSQVFRAKLE